MCLGYGHWVQRSSSRTRKAYMVLPSNFALKHQQHREHWTAIVLIFQLRQKANILATQWALHFARKAENFVYLINSCLCSNPGNLPPQLQFRCSSFLILDCHIMNLCKIRTISVFQQRTKENSEKSQDVSSTAYDISIKEPRIFLEKGQYDYRTVVKRKIQTAFLRLGESMLC